MKNNDIFLNYKYTMIIQNILDTTNLNEKQNKRLEEIYLNFKRKQISRNYETLIKDIYILFEIQNFTTIELSEIYNLSVRSIQKWIKELELKKITNKKKISKNIENATKKTKEILPEEVEDFLNYLESIKGKSPNTIKAYKSDLKLFFRFMIIHRELEFVTNESEFKNLDLSIIDISFIQAIKLRDFYAFLKFLDSERSNHSHAKARKVATLKAFFKFLNTKLKVISTNPAEELESPKIEKRHPIYLSLDESITLLKNMDKTDVNYYRDYCILTLFLNCGMRLSELCAITINKIKGDTLTVIGKGDKERTIYLNDSCMQSINDYLPFRDISKVNLKDRDFLFLSRMNRKLTPRSVEYLVKKHLKNSNLLQDKLSPHKLRHTAATLMYKYGDVDIRALQSILGHENVSTTQIYTHIDNERLREAIKANPLANIKKED